MTKAIKTETKTFEIPISFDKVTLIQYINWHNAENLLQKCAAALSVDVRECRNIRPQDMRLIVDGFQMVIDNELTRHEKVIHLNGTKYGYIPSVNKMSLGEYVDLDEANKDVFENEKWERLIDMMAVFYRPVTMTIGDHYRVEEYNGEEATNNRKDIEAMPMSLVSGALLFFSTIETELYQSSHLYLTTTWKKYPKEVSQLMTKTA